jgi:Type II CAAX prenyl endopeptidase Rce1-like
LAQFPPGAGDPPAEEAAVNERFDAGDRKFILVTLAVAVVCGAIALRYFGRAFPEASIQFAVNRSTSRQVAVDYLAELGLDPGGRKHAATFDYDEETKTFLERKLGLQRAQEVYGKQVRLWRWSHRWFRPHEKEELRVDVTAGGEVAAFQHLLAEDAAGAQLEADSARAVAEHFLVDTMHLQLADYDYVEGSSTQLPQRIDHQFTWKKRGLDLGDPDASYRMTVSIAGDRPSGYREFLDIPQAWQDDYARLRARNETAGLVATVFLLLTWVAMLGTIVFRIRDRDVKWDTVLGFGGVGCILQLLAALNGFDLEKFGYQTQDSYASFVTRFVLQAVFGALAYGGMIALLTAAAEPVYRERYPNKMALAGYFSPRGLRTKRFFKELLLGLVLMLFFAAYQSIFYVVAARHGAWAPLEVPYDNMLTTAIPWALVLFIGFFPAVSEEFTSRMFSVPFVDRLLARLGAPRGVAVTLAVVLSSFVWGFAHSNYPNQPFWIRGVEVGVAGIVVSVIMLRWGILATLVWHYTVDAFYTALLMLRSGNTYFVASGAVTAGLMVVPLAAALLLYWRRGGFEPDTGLRNADFPSPRASAPAVARSAGVGTEVAYEPVSSRRLMLGVAVAAGLLLLYLLPVETPGEGIVMRSDREAASDAARAQLRYFGADPDSYRVTVQLASRYEPSDGRYVLEHESIARLNELYTGRLRTPVWRVRFFRPDQREEYIFNLPVDEAAEEELDEAAVHSTAPETNQPGIPLWAFEHILPDSAMGDTLTTDAARLLASDFLREQGIEPDSLELKESGSERQKARIDHNFEWEVPDSTLAEAAVRYRVLVRGSEVGGMRPYLHLPEAWMRAYEERSVVDWVVWGLSLGLLGTGLLLVATLFVSTVRSRRFPWGAGLVWGTVGGLLVLGLAALRWKSDLLSRYQTEMPYQLFLVGIAISVFLLFVFAGLLITVLVGTIFAVRPRVRQLFAGGCDSRYVRDGVILGILGIALLIGVRRFDATLFDFGARYMDLDSLPMLDAASRALPWLDTYLKQMVTVLVLLPTFALVVLVVARRLRSPLTLGLLAAALLVVGADGARSMQQFGIQLASAGAGLALLLFAVGTLLRGNELAYVVAYVGARGIGAAVPWFDQAAPGAHATGIAIALLFVGTLSIVVLRAVRSRSSARPPA